MQEQKTWGMLIKHLSNEDSNEEKKLFLKWMNENEKNKILFKNVKMLWEDKNSTDESLTFRERFSKQKIKDFIVNQAIGTWLVLALEYG